jgi:hypothetical protein
MSWSGGKDSCMALHELTQVSRHEVAALITTITEDYDRISMHAPGVRCWSGRQNHWARSFTRCSYQRTPLMRNTNANGGSIVRVSQVRDRHRRIWRSVSRRHSNLPERFLSRFHMKGMYRSGTATRRSLSRTSSIWVSRQLSHVSTQNYSTGHMLDD